MVKSTSSHKLQLSPAMERTLLALNGKRILKSENLGGKFHGFGNGPDVRPSSSTMFALIDRGLIKAGKYSFPSTTYTITRKGREAIRAIREFQKGQG